MRRCPANACSTPWNSAAAWHRSGEEGIDELWGEPFAPSIPLEDFYESRYIKIGRVLR